MELKSTSHENLAETLTRVLPQASVLNIAGVDDIGLHHVAVPSGHELRTIDTEPLMEHPRRTHALAQLTDAESFVAYVNRHRQEHSVVWCRFDPQTFSLAFQAVIDEHAPDAAGWRSHQAQYVPAMSAEWKVWATSNKQVMSQLDFASFLERHEPDIATQEGYPTSLQMLKMATEFEANSEKKLKSVLRLQGGGVRLDYVDEDDAATLSAMNIFEKFQIGIPVFWAGAGYRIDARLKYRQQQGKVSFHYELIRADRVHEAAARELIERVRAGIGAVPLLMGVCEKPGR